MFKLILRVFCTLPNMQFISALNAIFQDSNEPIYHYIRVLELTFRDNAPPFLNSPEFENQLHAYLLQVLANKSECMRIINEILQRLQAALQANASPLSINQVQLPLFPQIPVSNFQTPTMHLHIISTASNSIPTSISQSSVPTPIIKQVTSVGISASQGGEFRVPSVPTQRTSPSPDSIVSDTGRDRTLVAPHGTSGTSPSAGTGIHGENHISTSTPKAPSASAAAAHKLPRTASDLERQLHNEGLEDSSMGVTLSSDNESDGEPERVENGPENARDGRSEKVEQKSKQYISKLESVLKVRVYRYSIVQYSTFVTSCARFSPFIPFYLRTAIGIGERDREARDGRDLAD